MRDMASPRWLPVDSVLGNDVAKATDAALAPLAAEARRIRNRAKWGTLLLFGSAVALAVTPIGPGGWLAAFAAVAATVFGGLLAVQTLKMWDGKDWLGRTQWSSLPEPDMPPTANSVLIELRSGARHARYRRGQSGKYVELSPQQLRGPFGLLLLSSDSRVQSLALRDWFGGDQLWVEFEQTQMASPSPEQDKSTTETLIREGDRDTESSPNLDPRLLLDRNELIQILDLAYPPSTRSRREALIVDALLLGNELSFGGLLPGTSKTLVNRIVAGLKAPNGYPVKLFAANGSNAIADHVFRHQKTLGAGYPLVGLKQDSDSSAWIEQTVAGRYEDIKRRLDAAEALLRAS